ALVIGLFGCIQFSILFFANAGLQNAVGDSARQATLWPRRTQSQLVAELDASKFGLEASRLSAPQFTYGTSGGQAYVEISMTYTTELDLAFFKVNGIVLSESRRAYLP
ncbi:MAG: hypothetical protein ACRC1J_00015, partial [Sandaracinobacteroides sp.]